MAARSRYVPSLRTKTAEWEALRLLSSHVRNHITPRLELLPQELDLAGNTEAPGLPEAMNRFARKVARNWGASAVFVDISHIHPAVRSESGEHPLSLLGRAASTFKVKAIATFGLYDDGAFQDAARQALNAGSLGAAIRLHYADLDKEGSGEAIESLVKALGLSCDTADLIVDCDIIDDAAPDYNWMCSRIPKLTEWRSFIIAGGSFPVNLEGLAIGTRIQPRYDWLHWQTWASAPKPAWARTPEFGDYTVQHPVFHAPPSGANPSASIRYAVEDYWVIMRGGPLRSKKTTGNKQYYGNAQLLCERDDFKGAAFSRGDKYISDVAERRDGPGNTTTWLRAAINHHITLTANQVLET